MKVVFMHLDLGIGGAEQLVLQLATVSQELNHQLLLLTTRCDPHHCFAPVKPDGKLHKDLRVWGRWIPADLKGAGRTLCSTMRVLYLTMCIIVQQLQADVIVVDVLPTPLPFLAQFTGSSLLFYCHFPDKLLKQNPSQRGGPISRLYRGAMNALESWGMHSADTVVVNSFFTRQVTLDSFPRLQQGESSSLPVLYPALDTTSLDQWRTEQGLSAASKQYRVVSLNRFERKKNLPLLLHAMDWIHQHHPSTPLPEIVMAGGYDTKNTENVEHLLELQSLAKQLNLSVDFRCSISDAERSELLHTARVVVYTPSNEHFGIVPLEAMYAGTSVVAVDNGGPKESIRSEETGFLCEATPAAIGSAILKLLKDSNLAEKMGQAGRQHVKETFGEGRMKNEWNKLIQETITRGRRRQAQKRLFLLYFFFILTLFWVLRLYLGKI